MAYLSSFINKIRSRDTVITHLKKEARPRYKSQLLSQIFFHKYKSLWSVKEARPRFSSLNLKKKKEKRKRGEIHEFKKKKGHPKRLKNNIIFIEIA